MFSPVILLLIAACLWSTSGVLIKMVDWNPLAISGVRSAIAAVVFAIAVRRPRLTWSRGQIAGTLCYAASVTLFVVAVKWTTAANAILLQYTAPIYVALLSAWCLDEPTKRSDWLAIGAMLIGISLFFFDELSTAGFWGNICALAGGVAFAGLIVSLRSQKHGSPFESVLFGNLIVAIVAIPAMRSGSPGARGWWVLLILGVFQLGIAHLLYARALKSVPAVEGAIIPMIEPILSPLWVFLLLGERPGPFALAGGSIVLGTVGVRTWLAYARPIAARPLDPISGRAPADDGDPFSAPDGGPPPQHGTGREATAATGDPGTRRGGARLPDA